MNLTNLTSKDNLKAYDFILAYEFILTSYLDLINKDTNNENLLYYISGISEDILDLQYDMIEQDIKAVPDYKINN
jgi:hypothetical protein